MYRHVSDRLQPAIPELTGVKNVDVILWSAFHHIITDHIVTCRNGCDKRSDSCVRSCCNETECISREAETKNSLDLIVLRA